MADYCFPSTAISTKKPRQLFSDLAFLSSFFFTHPLYFSFLFFSPYLLKLLALLSPLFTITTLLLLLLALLSGIFHRTSISSLLQNQHPKLDKLEAEEEETRELECFGGLGSPIVDQIRENPGAESVSEVPFLDHGGVLGRSEKNQVEFPWKFEEETCGSPTTDQFAENPGVGEGGRLVGVLVSDHGDLPEFFQETPDEFSGEFGEGERSELLFVAKKPNHTPLETPSSFNGGNHTQIMSNLGSMRRERDWSRTLACKLFEERHNVGGGGENMDLLWEAYERTEENWGKQSMSFSEEEKMNKKSRIVDFLEDFDEEEEEGNGQLCCLKALKFSAGKMSFGMSRSGFLKISKGFKGIGNGWLNHHYQQQNRKSF